MLSLLLGANTKMIVYAVVATLAMSAAGTAYWYYTSSQKHLAENAAAIQSLEIAVNSQEAVIKRQRSDAKLSGEILQELNGKFSESRDAVEQLREKFNKLSILLGENRFEKLSVAKPKVIEKVINKGTRDVIRCIEILSGQPLTNKEKEADRPSQYNSACADVANPKKHELGN